MRTLLAAILLGVLTACGTVESLRIPLTPAVSTSFAFVDERSPMSRASGKASSSARSGSFADDNVQPPLGELVRTWLEADLSAQLRGKTVRLENFDFGVVSRSGVVGQGQPPGITAIQSLGTPQSVYIKISGSVEGSRFTVDLYDQYYGSVSEENLRLALSKARAALAKEVLRAISAA